MKSLGERAALAGWLLASMLSSALASPPEAQLATARMAEFLHAEIGDAIEKRLANGGLDPADIKEIAVKATHGYAACIVETLAKDDDPRSVQMVSLLAERDVSRREAGNIHRFHGVAHGDLR